MLRLQLKLSKKIIINRKRNQQINSKMFVVFNLIWECLLKISLCKKV